MNRVVALLEPTYMQNRDTGLFAARFRRLGLTAYGNTREEALSELKRLFSFFVRKHRENGTLESFLNKADIEWYHEENYPQGKGPVEYVDEPHGAHRADTSQTAKGWVPDATLVA